MLPRVGYKGGRLRANWGVSVGSPFAGTTDTLDADGAATVAKAQAVVATWSGKGSVWICNNVVYAIPIEYGHSEIQAPQGMVRVTCAEMQNGGAEAAAR